ncbi:AraC-type DNA-binding protein [Streptomyces sp. TLI_053]|uniref:helix-turn-helix domain-containing protein n=1 Tax=Streptomyces sp. TLI_053 TaxID=1855352 RepID=UPI00087BBC11|nr:helix-turn-helix domain-containing protein [Streptomyces sp. TLI_053]SDS73656.1 AraC-type DNA-binding protein [Streptomyces sp. TLI_053]
MTDDGNRVRRSGRAASIAPDRAASVAPFPVTVAVAPDGTPADPGRTRTRRLGHLLFITTGAAPRCRTCGAPEIARGGREVGGPGARELTARDARETVAPDSQQAEGYFVVAVVGAGGAVVRQDGRTAEVPAGAVTFWYSEAPHRVDPPDGVDVRVCVIPRRALGVPDEQLRRVTATVADTSGPVAALVAQSLLALAETAGDCPELVTGRLARNFTDLVAVLVTAQTAPGAPAEEDSRYHRIQEIHSYIDRYLQDPGLDPKTIAAAHGISVRSLHKLFEGEDVTVSRLIQRRRLRATARELARRDGRRSTVSAVARRWGFTDPAHFSRAFRARYGISPSQYRDTRGPVS